MRARGWIAAAAMTGLAWTGGFQLAGQASASPRDGACFREIRALCSDVERGPGVIRRCLRSHRDLLSESCAALFERADRI